MTVFKNDQACDAIKYHRSTFFIALFIMSFQSSSVRPRCKAILEHGADRSCPVFSVFESLFGSPQPLKHNGMVQHRTRWVGELSDRKESFGLPGNLIKRTFDCGCYRNSGDSCEHIHVSLGTCSPVGSTSVSSESTSLA